MNITKIAFYLIIILLPLSTFATLSDFSLRGDISFYANNLEYFSDYREGELLLGTENSLYLHYTPHPSIEFSLGTYLQKDFGDKPFFSDSRPYFRGKYHKERYAMIIGVLESEKRHKLPDAMIMEQISYGKSIEEGLQFLFDYPHIFADLWIDVKKLNTPEHREHLDVGIYLENQFYNLTSAGMLYWDHYGGQLYAPDNDPVRNNITGSLLLSYVQPLKNEKSMFGADLRFLASSMYQKGNGYGFLVAPWYMINSYKTSLQVFKGDNYQSWRGNSMYHTNDIYYFLQLEREIALMKNLTLEWGVRFDFIDITPDRYFEHTEHQLWISITNSFEIPFLQKKESPKSSL